MSKRAEVAAVLCFLIWGAISAIAADWWVDSLGTGDGTDSSTPTNSIQGAIDAASAGDTINIYGATNRLYTHTNLHYLVDKENLTLTDWGTEKPSIQTADPGGVDENAIMGSILEIATNGVTVRNLRFEIYIAAYRTGDNVIELTVGSSIPRNNTTIDGCEFAMLDGPGGMHDAGAAIYMGSDLSSTNHTIKNCLFEDFGRDGWRYPMISGQGKHWLIACNTFANTDRPLALSDSQYVEVTSNRILNCTSDGDHGASDIGIIVGGYNDMKDAELSHNIVWQTNGMTTPCIVKGMSGWKGNVKIFNNTIYNTEMFIYATGRDLSETWGPLVVNNLILGSVTTNVIAGSNTIFNASTDIRHNMWYGGPTNFLGTNVVNGMLSPNYYVNAAIINLDDPSSPDFMRPDAGLTPSVLLGYNSVDPSYPSYIGAVEPRPGGLLFLVR